MLVTWELPKIFLQIWFISSLIDFLEPAKTRGWVLFLDPCNLSTGEVQWTTGLILWLYGNDQEGRQKTNKVSAPKLRASAGETRSLIPWSLEIAEALLDKSNTFENTIFQATLQLNACYSLLSRDLWNPQELAIAGQRFLLLYVSLCDSDPEGMFWRFKPKHHLFQELCEFDECCPSQNWTYRDEDMGGTVAAISRRRGGEPCLPFGVCLCFFPLLHSALVWCHMICRIWGKYNCFNFQKYIVQIHVSTRTSTVACCMKRKKKFLSSRH